MAWYHVTTYSFDPCREVQGPYPSEEICWEAMKKAAQEEYRIDTEEDQYDSFLAFHENSGEITLRNHFSDRDDVTTWFMIETPEREEKTPASATTVLDKNGPVYRINLYNRRFVIVEPDPTAAMSELCLVVAKLQKEGNHVTSVVQLTEGKATPRVKIAGTKEYLDAKKAIDRQNQLELIHPISIEDDLFPVQAKTFRQYANAMLKPDPTYVVIPEDTEKYITDLINQGKCTANDAFALHSPYKLDDDGREYIAFPDPSVIREKLGLS